MERYESWIDRAKSSYELSKANISTIICFVNCLRIAKNCLDWVDSKIYYLKKKE